MNALQNPLFTEEWTPVLSTQNLAPDFERCEGKYVRLGSMVFFSFAAGGGEPTPMNLDERTTIFFTLPFKQSGTGFLTNGSASIIYDANSANHRIGIPGAVTNATDSDEIRAAVRFAPTLVKDEKSGKEKIPAIRSVFVGGWYLADFS